jgi:hypothetical protein
MWYCTLSTQDPANIHSTESPVPVLEDNLTPSDIALSLLAGETILCPVANHAGRKWLVTVIFDTGASLSITHNLGDFVEPPEPLAGPMQLGGFANGTEIEGIGIFAWTFTGKDCMEVQLLVESYFVPASKQKMLSPQTLVCKEKGIFGSYSGDEEKFELKLNDQSVISIPCDKRSSLHIAEVLVGPESEHTVNLNGILEESKNNLTGGQNLLLEWHYRFAHLNFQALQSVLRRFPFVAKRFAAAVKCAPPKCEVYELAKANRRAKKAETKTKNPERDGALKADHLSPGLRVSVDHC